MLKQELLMHKIYSRPRIRIPKIIVQSKRSMHSEKGKKMTTLIVILIIVFSTVKIILDAVLPIFDSLCENRAKSIATMVSNEQATNVMKQHSYDELFNEIISDVANKIQEDIDNRGRENIEIALRKFYWF